MRGDSNSSGGANLTLNTMEQVEQKSVMYNYQREGRTCSTPNIDIAVARHDEGTTIYTTTFLPNGKTEVGTVTLN